MKTRKNDSASGFTLIEVIITIVVVAIVAAMMAAYFGTSITQSSLPIFRLNAAAKLNAILEKITADYNNNPPTWSPSTLYPASTSSVPPTILLPTAANRKGLQYICTNCTTTRTSGTTEPIWANCTVSGCTLPIDGTVQWTYSGTTPPTNWLTSTVRGSAYTVNDVVYPTNGYQYICTVARVIPPAAATEPGWSTAVAVDALVTADGFTWKCRGPQPLLALQTKIGAEVTGGKDYTQTFGGASISYRVIENRFITFDASKTEVSTPVTTGTTDYGKYLKVTIGFRSDDPDRTGETLTTLFVSR
jgi:prepilin-type N-terminal cleavage/methylation domain-containing protein